MFRQARIKLTLYYLAIIMAISVFFSLIIYNGATAELSRIEMLQRQRRPLAESQFAIEPEILEETKGRIALSLVLVNAVILGISGVAGYFLAGKTLDPIRKMVDEQKEFIGSASHELRTPLTSIRTEIEVGLRDKNLTLGGAKKLLASSLEEVNKMQKLSNYLLTLNRFQSGSGNLTFALVNLKNVAQKGIGKVEKLARAKGIKITAKLESTRIEGNEDSLTELTTILLENAIKYSDKGKEIVIKTKDKTLEVKDNGVGIAGKDLPHIFERFYRSDKSRGTDGYGLGLSIAKSIADIHDAGIKVESQVGTGSSFKVLFS